MFFDLLNDYKNDFEFAQEVNALPKIAKEERLITDYLWNSAKNLLHSLNYEIANTDKKSYITKNVKGIFRSKGASWIPYKTEIKKILSEIKNIKTRYFRVKNY